ncbi:MAG: UDP-N-acetylglucosamine--N-acetylmuramyl-(pentapeptide) pyrophosphoryl-undecaprenol N-acetylglucosamine transferase [Patescibacteria group bacterium]
MRILFTGGGTGGHFFPILAVIRELRRIAEEERILDLECYYMGPDDFGVPLLTEEDVVVIRVRAGKWRRYGSPENMLDALRIPVGLVQAVWNMFLVMPDAVFSKGGYGAVPAILAAAIFRIPIIIHESDAIPGKVNRFSARFAARVGIAFPEAARHFPPNAQEKIALVGIPLRSRILFGSREEAREAFDIYSAIPVVGIIGASQGAQPLNNAVLGIVTELTAQYEVLHQTGEKHFENVKTEAGVALEFGHKERYHPVGFLDETGIRDFYTACDLVVSRAGASSIMEIAARGKPSIVVPLSHAAQNHQWENAFAYAASGAAVILEEANVTPHVLLAEIKKLIDDPEKRAAMSKAALAFARPDSAAVVAKEILKLGLH